MIYLNGTILKELTKKIQNPKGKSRNCCYLKIKYIIIQEINKIIWRNEVEE